jgi:DNA mismatch endonuclease (patch repair protein)
LVLPAHNTVIFVHGCFWHRHRGCKKASNPSTRVQFWTAKFKANVERDKKSRALLTRAGWRVITIWECETKNFDRLEGTLRGFLHRRH